MSSNKLKIVLDTNVFIVSLLPRFKYHWVFRSLIEQQDELGISNEILTEYQEQAAKRFGLSRTDSNLDFLLLLPNVEEVTPHDKWKLIEADPDDDKFVDCAVAYGADYLVTNDKHFRVLQTVDFPPVSVISLSAFEKVLDQT